MTLWNIIRDFYVEYVFGGYLAKNGDFVDTNIIGYFDILNGEENLDYADTSVGFLHIGNSTISLGDWLSTTMTIITLIAICFFLFLFIRWLFRLTAGLIQGRG